MIVLNDETEKLIKQDIDLGNIVFAGDIQYHIDKCGDAHIIGKGNINFFTTQFSL